LEVFLEGANPFGQKALKERLNKGRKKRIDFTFFCQYNFLIDKSIEEERAMGLKYFVWSVGRNFFQKNNQFKLDKIYVQRNILDYLCSKVSV